MLFLNCGIYETFITQEMLYLNDCSFVKNTTFNTMECYSVVKRNSFEQAPGDSEEQGSLACCSPWGYKVSRNLATNNKSGKKERKWLFHFCPLEPVDSYHRHCFCRALSQTPSTTERKMKESSPCPAPWGKRSPVPALHVFLGQKQNGPMKYICSLAFAPLSIFYPTPGEEITFLSH